MKTIALVMIVKNEERCLKRCLDSARSLVDQIIVVDTGSQDRTQEIARLAGAKVYTYAWKNDFSDARNYALSLSDADWNIFRQAAEKKLPHSWNLLSIWEIFTDKMFIWKMEKNLTAKPELAVYCQKV